MRGIMYDSVSVSNFRNNDEDTMTKNLTSTQYLK